MRVYPVAVSSSEKKLRRVPRFYSKMLELPLGADADVYAEENHSMLRFFAAADGVSSGVRAQTLVVPPGLMKIVILNNGDSVSEGYFGEEFELDRWRLRLPSSVQPALATAEYVDGVIVVTVPKGDGSEERVDFEAGSGDFPVMLRQLSVFNMTA